MTAMTDYLEEALLNHVFRSVYYTPPGNAYLALYVSQPDETGAGTEVTGGSYVRQPVSFAAAVSPAGRLTNDAACVYSNMPDAEIVGVALVDDIVGGNMLTYYVLDTPRTVVAGDNLTVNIGDLNVYFA